MNKTKEFIINAAKGFAMGVANVIPGVSGGTIALITNVFERIINSLKSFDFKALSLLKQKRLKEFAQHTDIVFLMSIIIGIGIGIVTFARLLEYLFIVYPVFLWAFFFGLIVASVFFIVKEITKYSFSVILSGVLATIFAIFLTQLRPATPNESFIYLFISGVLAICSMILPGLSGSYVLLLLGVYHLVLHGLNTLNLKILIAIGLGAVIGLLAFSHFLSWLLKKYKNQTMAALTGFVIGSVYVIWPFKKAFDINGNTINLNEFGSIIDKTINPKTVIYTNTLPSLNMVLLISVVLAILGASILIWLEKTANQKTSDAQKAS